MVTVELWGKWPCHAVAYSTLLQGLQLQLCEFQPDVVIVLATLGLTATPPQLPHAAGRGHRVGHTRCQQGQREGTLAKTWEQERHTQRVETDKQRSSKIVLRLCAELSYLPLYPSQKPRSPFWPLLACLRLSPLLRMVLWWGSLPRPSSEEQFQRWSRSWCWHSWMATWMPCRAEAVTSGLRTHIRIWRLLRPASLRHTELGVSTGSPATLRLRISLHSTLQRERKRGRERESC